MHAIPVDQQNIIAILGIENLPQARKIQVLDKITTLVQKRLLVRIHQSLAGRFQERLGELLEAGDSETLSEFLEQHVPNLPELIEAETTEVKKELGQWSSSIT